MVHGWQRWGKLQVLCGNLCLTMSSKLEVNTNMSHIGPPCKMSLV